MTNNHKTLKCLLIVLFSTLLFCGCENDLSENKSSMDSSNKTEITWWTFPVFAQENTKNPLGTYEQKLIDAFEEENPDITVKLELLDYITGPEKLEAGFTTKDICDILLDAPGRIIEYGNRGYLVTMEDMFTKEFIQDVDNEELIGACKSGENAYMYPLSSAPFYMAFNRRMLEEADVLDLVREGWTTKDFDKVIRALKKNGFVPGFVFCDGTGGDQGTRAFVANLYDSSVMDDAQSEYTLGNEKGIKALEYIKSCVDEGLILDGTLLNGTEAVESFVYGRASFSILWGPSQQRNYEKLMDEFDVEAVEVPLPSENGEAELEYLVNGFCVMNNGDDKKIEASKRFIDFACNDEVWGAKDVIQTGCIPVRNFFEEIYSGDERMTMIEQWTSYYIPYYNTVKGFANMRCVWCQALKDILSGYGDTKDIAENFEKKANKTLEEN